MRNPGAFARPATRPELGDADLEDVIPQCLIKVRRWLQGSNFDMWTMTDAADDVAPDLTLCQW